VLDGETVATADSLASDAWETPARTVSPEGPQARIVVNTLPTARAWIPLEVKQLRVTANSLIPVGVGGTARVTPGPSPSVPPGSRK
jgi:hypothetical protein